MPREVSPLVPIPLLGREAVILWGAIITGLAGAASGGLVGLLTPSSVSSSSRPRRGIDRARHRRGRRMRARASSLAPRGGVHPHRRVGLVRSSPLVVLVVPGAPRRACPTRMAVAAPSARASGARVPREMSRCSSAHIRRPQNDDRAAAHSTACESERSGADRRTPSAELRLVRIPHLAWAAPQRSHPPPDRAAARFRSSPSALLPPRGRGRGRGRARARPAAARLEMLRPLATSPSVTYARPPAASHRQRVHRGLDVRRGPCCD